MKARTVAGEFARVVGIALFAAAALAASALAVTVNHQEVTAGVGEKSWGEPPMRLAEAAAVEPAASLRPAREGAADQLEAVLAWNREGRLPARGGISRALPESFEVALDAALAAKADSATPHSGGFAARSVAGSLVWGTRVRVAEASRIRLHLTEVNLPAEARLWVWGLTGKVRPFGLELKDPENTVWTPSAKGEDLFLEVEVPAAAFAKGESFGFRLTEVGELLGLRSAGQSSAVAGEKTGECIVDGKCTTSGTLTEISAYRAAVAHLEFFDSPFWYLCSGGLLNDTDAGSTIPYLLTANHCFDTQTIASTLEAYWDYIANSCNGSWPDLGDLDISNGSTLLATGSYASGKSDFTLVELDSIPSGRTLLGWTTGSIASGTEMHRLSHPVPESEIWPQAYSRSILRSSGVPTCSGINRPTFNYAEMDSGGTFGGSSGAPSVLGELSGNDGLWVVGQLLGGCGVNPDDGCDYDNSEIDGAFSATYPYVDDYLSPSGSCPCVEDSNTMCLVGNRFKVEVEWEDYQANTGDGQVVQGVGTDNSGIFYFFNSTNWEMLLKVLNGCTVNNRYWVYFAATTDVEFVTTVTDTDTCDSAVYTNTLGHAADAVTDADAFATCP